MNPVIAAIDMRRKELRLSQAELARRASTTQSHVSDILTGRIGASLRVVSRLCDAVGLRLVAVDSNDEVARAAQMHPATLAVAANQRRLAGALQDMADVLVEVAKALEEEQ